MKTRRKPAELGNVNAAFAGKLQIIDDTQDPPRWKTIGECADTPNMIARELARLGNPKNTWIKTAEGRRPLF